MTPEEELQLYSIRERRAVEELAQGLSFMQSGNNLEAARKILGAFNLYSGLQKDYGKMPKWAFPLFEEEVDAPEGASEIPE